MTWTRDAASYGRLVFPGDGGVVVRGAGTALLSWSSRGRHPGDPRRGRKLCCPPTGQKPC